MGLHPVAYQVRLERARWPWRIPLQRGEAANADPGDFPQRIADTFILSTFLNFALNQQRRSGFGITVGVHRLWSHRSYSAAFPVRFALMLMNSMANQVGPRLLVLVG